MDFKNKLIEKLNLSQIQADTLYHTYIDACEEIAKEYHAEQLKLCEVGKSFNACFQVGDKVKFKTVNGTIFKDLRNDFFEIKDDFDNYIWQAHKDSIILATESI